jgi:hypothetical protein
MLSDHGSQFTSLFEEMSFPQRQIFPLRHPESNAAERIMRELNEYLKVYCKTAQEHWPELVPYIINWLNTSVSGTTWHSPIDVPKPDSFRKFLDKTSEAADGRNP